MDADCAMDLQDCAMDVVKVAKELRKLLMAHDKVVTKIATLDARIDQINRGLLVGDLFSQDGHTSLCHLQTSVLSGVREMLEHYRLRKLQQIQTLSRSIIGTLTPEELTEDSATQSDLTSATVTIDRAAINYTMLSRERYRTE